MGEAQAPGAIDASALPIAESVDAVAAGSALSQVAADRAVRDGHAHGAFVLRGLIAQSAPVGEAAGSGADGLVVGEGAAGDRRGAPGGADGTAQREHHAAGLVA